MFPTNPSQSPNRNGQTSPGSSVMPVSIHDLFKNISPIPQTTSSTPPITQPTALAPSISNPPSSAMSPTVPTSQHTSRLLGLLSGIGGSPATSSPVSTTPKVEADDVVSAGQLGGGTSQKQNLLSMLNSTTKAEPVITHPSESPGVVGGNTPKQNLLNMLTNTAQTQSNTTHHSTPSPAADPAIETSSTTTVPPSTSKQPFKSMFDFVSPFDAFEAPRKLSSTSTKARTASVGVSTASGTNTESSQAQAVAGGGERSRSVSHNVPLSKQNLSQNIEKAPSTVPLLPGNINISNTEGISKQSSRAASVSSSSGGGGVMESPYLVKKIIGKGVGKGPRSLTAHTTIDLSKPNLDSLVTSPNAVQILPASILKHSEEVKFKKGRSVGVTESWISYTLSKNRIRLIDNQSGSKLILQLPNTSIPGPIIDLAVTNTLIAAIAPNHSISIFRVPSSWNTDNPEYEEIAHITPDSEKIGLPDRVEWIKKDGRDHLVIGGNYGVVIAELKGHEEFLSSVVEDNKVLTTDGAIVAFCVNSTHQAIGLLSENNFFSIYNISTLNRVWHKQFPTTSDSGEPCSVQFCEAMVLVGRDDNTHFDLLQITVDLAIIASIKLTIPSPTGTAIYHFAQATYDNSRNILWIASHARGSIYAFTYGLKSRPPIKVSKGEEVIAFTHMAEYILEPVTSFVLAQNSEESVTEMFFASPNGFSQALIDVSALTSATQIAMKNGIETTPKASTAIKPSPSKPPTQAQVSKEPTVDQQQSIPTKPLVKASPKVAIKESAPPTSTSDVEVHAQQTSNTATPSKATSVPSEDISKALKKTEDRLITQFRQALSQHIEKVNTRIDGLSDGALSAELVAAVDKSVKANLINIIPTEIKKSTLPAIQTSVSHEVRALAANEIPSAIQQSLKGIPKTLESSLAPIIQRNVALAVTQTVDKAVNVAVQRAIMPALERVQGEIIGKITDELRSELLQVRKDMSPQQRFVDPIPDASLLQNLADSVAALQQQVANLSAQLTRPQGVPQGPPQHTSFPQPPSNGNISAPFGPSVPPVPTNRPIPPPQQLEDIFLTALTANQLSSTLGLLNDFWELTEYALPLSGKSPLSQAVILTLLHRTALAVVSLHPPDPSCSRMIVWAIRSATLVDPHNEATSGFYPRVLGVVVEQLSALLQQQGQQQQQGLDIGGQARLQGARQILDILRGKA